MVKLNRSKSSSRDFYAGVLAALAVVADADQETLYRQIVNTMSEEELVAAALSDEGTAEWAGLVRYGYCPAPGVKNDAPGGLSEQEATP